MSITQNFIRNLNSSFPPFFLGTSVDTFFPRNVLFTPKLQHRLILSAWAKNGWKISKPSPVLRVHVAFCCATLTAYFYVAYFRDLTEVEEKKAQHGVNETRREAFDTTSSWSLFWMKREPCAGPVGTFVSPGSSVREKLNWEGFSRFRLHFPGVDILLDVWTNHVSGGVWLIFPFWGRKSLRIGESCNTKCKMLFWNFVVWNYSKYWTFEDLKNFFRN